MHYHFASKNIHNGIYITAVLTYQWRWWKSWSGEEDNYKWMWICCCCVTIVGHRIKLRDKHNWDKSNLLLFSPEDDGNDMYLFLICILFHLVSICRKTWMSAHTQTSTKSLLSNITLFLWCLQFGEMCLQVISFAECRML